MSTMDNLDPVDKQILNIIQSGFPIAPRPYQIIANDIGISEEDAFKRVQNLKSSKLVRRLGANFQSSKLGFRSTLCAAKVPEEKMEEFTQRINGIVGVTHNYLRKHEFNIWFTLIASSWEKVEETLADITKDTGIPILNLPASIMYKIKVNFQLDE